MGLGAHTQICYFWGGVFLASDMKIGVSKSLRNLNLKIVVKPKQNLVNANI
jgi:hypothetical protein